MRVWLRRVRVSRSVCSDQLLHHQDATWATSPTLVFGVPLRLDDTESEAFVEMLGGVCDVGGERHHCDGCGTCLPLAFGE